MNVTVSSTTSENRVSSWGTPWNPNMEWGHGPNSQMRCGAEQTITALQCHNSKKDFKTESPEKRTLNLSTPSQSNEPHDKILAKADHIHELSKHVDDHISNTKTVTGTKPIAASENFAKPIAANENVESCPASLETDQFEIGVIDGKFGQKSNGDHEHILSGLEIVDDVKSNDNTDVLPERSNKISHSSADVVTSATPMSTGSANVLERKRPWNSASTDEGNVARNANDASSTKKYIRSSTFNLFSGPREAVAIPDRNQNKAFSKS